MATQLKHTDFAYTPAAAARPNVRVAFIAGDATTAVRDAMAKLPDDTRDGTLDDLVRDPGVATASTAVSPTLRMRVIPSTNGISPALDALLADADVKDAAYKAYTREHLTPAEKRYYFVREQGDSAVTASAKAAKDAIVAHQEALVAKYISAEDEVAHYAAATPADLHAKLAFMVKHDMFDGVNWGAELLADAGRIATVSQSSVLRSLLHQRNAIWNGVDAANLTDEQGAARCRDISGIENTILAAPAVTADDAVVKMITALQIVAHGVELEDAEAALLLRDARRHFGIGQGLDHLINDARAMPTIQQPDEAILNAFAERRREFVAMEGRDTTQEDEDAYWARVDPLEDVILTTQANTIEGVLVKLRVAFQHQVGELWSDQAIVDPASPVFVEGVKDTGGFTRLAWTAIEDLARIGSVDLSAPVR